ncbi:MAG: ATP-binding protein [Patescibacteria group bacterium]
MNFVDLLLATIGIANFFLAFFVFYRNPKSVVNSSFAIFILNAVLWSFIIIFFRITANPSVALLWGKAIYIPGTLVPASFLYFSYAITRRRPPSLVKTLFLALLPLPFFIILFRSTYFVRSLSYDFYGNSLSLGPIYPIWVFYFGALMSFGAYLLWKRFRKSSGLEKAQLRLILLAIIFPLIGALPFNFVLPFYGNYRYIFIGPIFLTFMTALISYAIIKHRFLDIRLVAARAVSYTLLSLIIVIFYTLTLFVIGQWVFPTPLNGDQLIISVFLTLIVVYSFQPLRRYMERVTDKLFFKEIYNPEELLGRVSKVFATTLGLGVLVKGVLDELLSTLHLDFGVLLLRRPHGQYENIGSKKVDISQKQAAYFFSRRQSLIVFDELREGRLKDYMRQNSFGAIIKLNVDGKELGTLCLGTKLAGDVYTGYDIKVLGILGPEFAVAIQNAQRYEEAKKFGEKLKEEVGSATADLRKVNRRLKGIDKLKDEFISMAAHELRSPMTAVKGYLSMVIEGDLGRIPKKSRGYLVDAEAINDRLIRLVNNMLNVSRIEEGRMVYQMENVNLSEIAQIVYNQFKLEVERKGLVLSLDIPRELKDKVYVDSDRALEVIANLVSNSIKYTQKGFVEMKLSQPKKNIVRFEVRDTGTGISKDEQRMLFRKFYRVESHVGKTIGTGLGLFISKLLVEKFKGEIGVNSSFGKGSTFWFELPLTKNKPS